MAALAAPEPVAGAQMDIASYFRFVAALVLVLGLIGLAAWAVRRFGLAGRLPATRPGSRRLGVVEFATLGPRHRLALVKRDAVEHLLLLGPTGDLVIERGIGAPADDDASGEEGP